jgi:hypothetical protein
MEDNLLLMMCNTGFITKTVYGLVLKPDENETVSVEFLYKELFV